MTISLLLLFFFSSRRRHTRCLSDWSSDVCSSDLRNLGEKGKHGELTFDASCCRAQPMHGPRFGIGEAEGNGRLERRDVRSEERRVGKEGRLSGISIRTRYNMVIQYLMRVIILLCT